MITVFALFRDLSDAEVAVHELIHRRFDISELNVIAQEVPAKAFLEGPPEETHADLADRLAGKGDFGLGQLLSNRLAMVVPDAGRLLASGDLGNTLVRTASVPGAAGGLRAALVDFGLPEQAAEAYRSGVGAGGLALIVRTSDERAGEAAEVMRLNHGSHVAAYNR